MDCIISIGVLDEMSMQDIQATRIWLLLIGLTFISFIFARMGYQGEVLIAVVLLSAWLKGQMIIDSFMKLRRVRQLWRIIISVWLLVVLSVITSMYLSFG